MLYFFREPTVGLSVVVVVVTGTMTDAAQTGSHLKRARSRTEHLLRYLCVHCETHDGDEAGRVEQELKIDFLPFCNRRLHLAHACMHTGAHDARDVCGGRCTRMCCKMRQFPIERLPYTCLSSVCVAAAHEAVHVESQEVWTVRQRVLTRGTVKSPGMR